MIVIQYVDDFGLACATQGPIDELIENLKKKGFQLTVEGSFSEFLGIKYEQEGEAIAMTQKGLIGRFLTL